jgi:hypothetical protein
VGTVRAIHIGFPKTATTFLQTAVFPRLAGERLVYVSKDASARLFAPLIHHDDTIFDPLSIADRLREHSTDAPTALFSYEGLTGEHYRSGFVNRSQIARRLRRVGFERVLITIRNQFDVLESAYRQHVKTGGVLRFRDYASLDPDKPTYLHPRYFDYHLIYGLYSTTFGRDNVLVLQHEQLDEPAFFTALTDFLGTPSHSMERRPPANASLSNEKTAVLRVLNHFTFSTSRPSSLLGSWFSSAAVYRGLRALPFANSDRSCLTPEDRSSITELYAASNRSLAEAAGITLAAEYP